MKFPSSYIPYIVYLFLFIAIYSLLFHLGFHDIIPSNQSLNKWDVGWYFSIVKEGYRYFEGKQCNLAFFPAFPLTCKFFNLSVIQASFMNIILFFLSFFLIHKSFKLNSNELLMFMSVPSLMFCLVPYSESFFFFFCVLLLVGLKKNNNVLVFVGLFLACSTRSASLTFLPSITLISLYFSNDEKLSKRLKKYILLVLVLIVSVLCVAAIQYLYTGLWFKFLSVQKFWDREFNIPSLPLSTWGNYDLLWLDGLALLFGIFSSILLLIILYKKQFYKASNYYSTTLIFSLSYISTATFVVIFFNATSPDRTSIYSLNRFIFSTPFFIIILINLMRKQLIPEQLKKVSLISITLSWLIIGIFIPYELNLSGYIQNIIYFSTLTSACYFLYLAIIKRYVSVINYLFIINTFIQVFLFTLFLKGEWVG